MPVIVDKTKYYKQSVYKLNKELINNGVYISNQGIAKNFFNVGLDIPKEYKSTDNIEYVIKFTTGTVVTDSVQAIIHSEYFFSIEINNDGGIFAHHYTNSDFTTAQSDVLFTATDNTTYRLKISINGGTKSYYISEDGIEWTLLLTNSTSVMTKDRDYYICMGNNSGAKTYPFLGSIDLKETYIIKNETEIWRGYALTYSDRKVSYYKYMWDSWLQPINPDGIKSTSGWINTPYAFDGDSSTYAYCGTNTDYIEYDLGTAIKFTGVTILGNWVSAVARAMDVIVKSVDENDVEIQLGVATGSAATTNYTLSLSCDETLVTKLRFYLASENYEGNPPTTSYPTRLVSITLNNTQSAIGSETATIDDYDYVIYGDYLTEEDDYEYSETIPVTYSIFKPTVKYYRNLLLSWSQPIFSSNILIDNDIKYQITASHQSQPAWWAFNGSHTSENCWWTNHGETSTSNPAWIQFYSSVKIKLDKLDILNEFSTPENFKTAILQASNTGKDWIDLTTITGTNSSGYTTSVEISTEEGYHYYRLLFTASYSTSGVSIQTITFYGNIHKVIESTIKNYDYLKIISIPYQLVVSKETYYKYVWTDWIQPVLTSNGVIGGDTFATSASSELDNGRQAYHAFDGVTTDNNAVGCWHSLEGLPAWIQFYNPTPLNISSLSIINRSNDGAYINEYGVSYSDDGENFNEFITGISPSQEALGTFDITVDVGEHKFWKITAYSASGDNSTYASIGEINITATHKIAVESSKDDYDYFETNEYYY